jgi:hypothetical protein
MEAEEYGEMMESVDEVNFALDGMRPTAPRRVRRASMLSLLGICASAAHRRVLRAQGSVRLFLLALSKEQLGLLVLLLGSILNREPRVRVIKLGILAG